MGESQFHSGLFWSLGFIALTAVCRCVRPDAGLDCTFCLIRSAVIKRERAEGSSLFNAEENFDSPDERSSTSCLEGRDHNMVGVKRRVKECRGGLARSDPPQL